MKQSALLLLFAFIFSNIIQAQWTSLGQSGFNATSAPWMSLALDTNGTPYIAFEDVDNASNKLTVMKYASGHWTAVGGPGISPNDVNFTAIVIGPDNLPYVAYQDNGTGGSGLLQASVMHYTGSAWVYIGNPNLSIGPAAEIALSFDHSGTLYISYIDPNAFNLTIQKYNGTAWVNVGTQPTVRVYPTNSAVAMAFDPTDVPYISFSDADSSGRISVLKYNGNAWTYLGKGGFTSPSSDWASLAFSGSTPYVAFADGNDTMKVSAMKYIGNSWVNAGNAGFSPGTGNSNISLATDRGGVPCVAYSDGYGELGVSKFDGTNWAGIGASGFNPDPASFVSIAVDRSGDVFVAYDPSSMPTDAPVVEFQKALGIAQISTASAISTYPNPCLGILSFDLNTEVASHLHAALYNSIGQQSGLWPLETRSGANHFTIDLSSKPEGIYVLHLIDEAGNNIQSTKMMVRK